MDLGGDQVTELNTQNGTASVPLGWAHSNVFSAARLTATYDTSGLHYALADPLGTKRVQANISGQIEESCISLPFGDALSCTPTALTTADDATEHHFTDKERDTESGNDYFFARYYNSALGRFTTPDWSAKTDPVPYAVFTDPQSLNLYAYVRNNPLIRLDDDGHAIIFMTTGPTALNDDEQVARDSIDAIRDNPDTHGFISGYEGKGAPDLIIQKGDQSEYDSSTLKPDGTPGGSVTGGSFEPVYTSGTEIHDGVEVPTTIFSGGIITIDNRTKPGDIPKVMVHETEHAGDAKGNPTKYKRDGENEHKNPCHDCRPQEQRAIGAQNKYGPAITKAVKQKQKERKKKEQTQ